MTVHNVRPEAIGCTVGGDRKDFCDPVGEELGRVSKMPRLSREEGYRFTNREEEATESVKKGQRKIWEFPTPPSPGPGDHIRIGDEVAVPKVGMLSFGAVEAG